MTYATADDMRARYSNNELIKLTNRNERVPQAVNESVLTTALDTASSMIDGYLAVRYSLPLSTVPVALTQAACVIARYTLESGKATEQAAEQYKTAIRYLTDISKGVVQLGLGADGTVPENNDGAVIESAGSVFSRDRSKGFI